MTPLLLNAARAFAMVSFSDGRLAPTESHRFAEVARADPGLTVYGHAEVADAWAQAMKEVHASQSFGTVLLLIRTEVTSQPEKALMMRIAQAAVVADGKLDPQENVAIAALAEALGLKPEKY